MRVVILTMDGIEHRYVTDVLAAGLGNALEAVVIAEPAPRPFSARWRSYFRRYSVGQVGSRVAAKLYAKWLRKGEHKTETYRRMLGAALASTPSWYEIRYTVAAHNGAECQELLRELRPDIIAVYGTGIIKRPVISLAGTAILNMHTGLSPRYRGSDTIFWSLHNEEPEWVGVTVHVLDEGVDSGPVIRTGRPEIAADDHEDSLFCKAVMVGAPLYVEAIFQVFAEGVTQPPQRLEEGRTYRFVDRTVAAERRVRRLLKNGMLRRYTGTAR